MSATTDPRSTPFAPPRTRVTVNDLHSKLNPTIVVFRDDTLSLIKLKQERMGLPETGVRTGSPDYALLAQAYGGQGVVVEDVESLRRAAQTALEADTFTLIDARIDPAEYRKQM